jgi:hypothetical protein
MPKFAYEAASSVEAEGVIGALTDFSEKRLRLWPAIDPHLYAVHNVGETSADVTEGTTMSPVGSFSGREHYDWSTAGVVRATVSNSRSPTPAESGSFASLHVLAAAATSPRLLTGPCTARKARSCRFFSVCLPNRRFAPTC